MVTIKELIQHAFDPRHNSESEGGLKHTVVVITCYRCAKKCIKILTGKMFKILLLKHTQLTLPYALTRNAMPVWLPMGGD